MKLLEGLQEGLKRHVQEMKGDEEFLANHEALVGGVVPQLTERHATLEAEATSLQQLTDELENCDQEELRSAREQLSNAETEVEVKKRQLCELQALVKERTETVESAAEVKEEYAAQIKEAERVREECRGWSAREIGELKASVESLERQTGWSIVVASPSTDAPVGPRLVMCYRGQLCLSFYPGAFDVAVDGKKMNMPIGMVYSPRTTSPFARPSSAQLSPIGSFVLNAISGHLSALQQSNITPRQLLQFIAQTWDQYFVLEEEARKLEVCGVTALGLVEEEEAGTCLKARCNLVSRRSAKSAAAAGQQKRVDVEFSIKPRIDIGSGNGIGSMHFETRVSATKVYGFGMENGGDGLSESGMLEILRVQLGLANKARKTTTLLGDGAWRKAVQELVGVVF